MGGASWIYFLFYTMLNYWEFGQIWLAGGAVYYLAIIIKSGADMASCWLI